MSCSFFEIVGSVCGVDERSRSHTTAVIPLSLCDKDIKSHMKSLQFSGVSTEADLILARCGIDFSDPQGGKGVCDRQAAIIKGDIGRYVNEGNDVMNGEQLKAAIESGQGTTGVKASYVAANTSRTPSVKWDGISLLNSLLTSLLFQYEEKGVRAWRAFNVGPGKLFPWATFEGAA